ncbi:MAG: class I SAM-dependent methyltransferase [Planctomycetes bacterium]|nr:class I SAM-dependent methyltransferase [Planctomycetota bacterium]
MNIMNLLKLPQTDVIEDLDDPSATMLHAEIINSKRFLRKLYVDFYRSLKRKLPESARSVVELGSGGGFIKEIIPFAQTSDVLDLPGLDHIFSALEMPFGDSSIDAFIMIDVLHHIPNPEEFFRQADRCLVDGGKIIMIEPANTPWSRFIYKNFHHEDFNPQADWNLSVSGPLSQANGALPWIIFNRDRKKFCDLFPELEIAEIKNHTPIRYLLSGGLTLRQLVPSWTYGFFKTVEYLASPVSSITGMFQTIEIIKRKA